MLTERIAVFVILFAVIKNAEEMSNKTFSQEATSGPKTLENRPCCIIGVRRFCRQKLWKNRSAKAMSKMLAKQVNFRQNGFQVAVFRHISHRKGPNVFKEQSNKILQLLIMIITIEIL